MFAIDLNNEPHGAASWGDGSRTDWRLGAERLAAVVLEANPRLLVFVEGVERNAVVQPADNCWWGGHCAAAAKVPQGCEQLGRMTSRGLTVPYVWGWRTATGHWASVRGYGPKLYGTRLHQQ